MNLKIKGVLLVLSLLVILMLVFLNAKVALPNSVQFYNLKRLIEKSQMAIKKNPQDRLEFLSELQDRRLEELKYVAGNGISEHVYKASSRFSTTTGQMTELIVQNNLEDEARKAREKFESQLTVINGLIQNYPKKNDEKLKFIIDDQNYLLTYIGQLESF